MKIDVKEDLKLSLNYEQSVQSLNESCNQQILKNLQENSEKDERKRKEILATIEAKLFYKLNKQSLKVLDITSHYDILRYLLKCFPDASESKLHWFLFSCFKIPVWVFILIFLSLIVTGFILLFSIKTLIICIVVFLIIILIVGST